MNWVQQTDICLKLVIKCICVTTAEVNLIIIVLSQAKEIKLFLEVEMEFWKV